MKILQLCKKFPYPLKDGEAIAVTYLSKALHELGASMSLLSMNTTKHFFDIGKLPDSFAHYEAIHLVTIDNRVKVADAFLNLFSNDSYHISRYISENFEAKLIELLQSENYDFVQLETLYLAPYIETIRKYSSAKIIMRSHNVEHEIWKRITQNTRIGAKKIYLNLLTSRLENFEVANLNRYDMMLAITQRDLNFFEKLGCRIPAKVVPIGLDIKDYQEPNFKVRQAPRMCFIGSLDWMPNIEGIEWILNEVWDELLVLTPNAELHIAGRNTPEWLLNTNKKNVFVHGEVPSAAEFINAHEIMLVPLFSGSGMRVKILEGMALGRVVISTQLGLEGIPAKNNKEVLIGDTKEAFLDMIQKCYAQPELMLNMSALGTKFIREHYDNVEIAREVYLAYEEMLNLGNKVNEY